MTVRDAAEFGVAAAARAQEGAMNDRPTGLDGALVGLRERFSGEENRGDRKLRTR